MQYRQGDVLLERVAELPPDTRRVKRDGGRIILAYGEATGHSHAITDRQVTMYRSLRDEDQWLVIRGHGAAVIHEEHATIDLPPGIYRVRRQREYSPQEVRRVAD